MKVFGLGIDSRERLTGLHESESDRLARNLTFHRLATDALPLYFFVELFDTILYLQEIN